MGYGGRRRTETWHRDPALGFRKESHEAVFWPGGQAGGAGRVADGKLGDERAADNLVQGIEELWQEGTRGTKPTVELQPLRHGDALLALVS